MTVIIGAVHSVLGERRLIGPLVSPKTRQGMLAKSVFARQLLRFAWHVTTIAWWGMAAILAALAMLPLQLQSRFLLLSVAATFLVTGLVTLIALRGRHLAWPVFLAITALTLWPLV